MAHGTGLAQAVVKYSNGQELSQGVHITRRWAMDVGIVVTAFYLFGMLGLVILDASLEEPTPERVAKPKARAAHKTAEARTYKRAA